MMLVGRPDEPVIGNVQQLPEILDADDNLIDILLGRHALGFGLALDFLAMLVRAGQEHDIIALQPFVAGHGVGGNGRVGMTDMQLVARIVNRCRDVECRLHRTEPSLLQQI